jgi:hypothetical protein
MEFQVGDRVRLIADYWVAHPGDCRTDSNVRHLKVGEATGTLTQIEDRITAVGIVTWDERGTGGNNLRVNLACLGDELDEEDLNEVLKSISRTFQDRKKS